MKRKSKKKLEIDLKPVDVNAELESDMSAWKRFVRSLSRRKKKKSGRK